MKSSRWYPLLALGLLAPPIAGQTKGPQPKITEIASIPGVRVPNALKMPNGHVIVYGSYQWDQSKNSLTAYDLRTKRSTIITGGWDYGLAISAQGDRLAYVRFSKDRKNDNVWTIPIDPATGMATGPAQRITVTEGDVPSFSPDGKWLAYSEGLVNGRTGVGGVSSVIVVPATGGPSRVVARYDQVVDRISWSADGKWIYVTSGHRPAGQEYRITRVRATGGEVEELFSHPSIYGTMAYGLMGFYSPSPSSRKQGRHGYVTAAGTLGEFQGPPDSDILTASGTTGPLLRTVESTSKLRILDLDDGRLKDLPFDPPAGARAIWSPDQTRLAIAFLDEGKQTIAVMNTDGSAERRYTAGGAVAEPLSWTPDGDGLLYLVEGRSEIRLLNLATGRSHAIATGPAPRVFHKALWMPGGHAFRIKTYVRAVPGSLDRVESASLVEEIHLDGTRRVIRDLSKEFPEATAAFLQSPQQAVLGFPNEEEGTGLAGFLVVPLDGGRAQPVHLPNLESGTTIPLVAGYSSEWITTDLVSRGRAIGALVVSTSSEPGRVLSYPDGFAARFGLTLLLPDSKELVKIGLMGSDTTYTVLALPLDGSAPRALARVPQLITGMSGWRDDLSPDGRRLAFFERGVSTTHLYDIDLTPITALVNKK